MFAKQGLCGGKGLQSSSYLMFSSQAATRHLYRSRSLLTSKRLLWVCRSLMRQLVTTFYQQSFLLWRKLRIYNCYLATRLSGVGKKPNANRIQVSHCLLAYLLDCMLPLLAKSFAYSHACLID